MGTPVRAPDPLPLGYELVVGRLLASEEGPGALFMYQDGEDKRIVLYACRNDEGEADTAFRFGRQGKVSVFYWTDGPLSYALAGKLDRERLQSVSEAVYYQL